MNIIITHFDAKEMAKGIKNPLQRVNSTACDINGKLFLGRSLTLNKNCYRVHKQKLCIILITFICFVKRRCFFIEDYIWAKRS